MGVSGEVKRQAWRGVPVLRLEDIIRPQGYLID